MHLSRHVCGNCIEARKVLVFVAGSNDRPAPHPSQVRILKIARQRTCEVEPQSPRAVPSSVSTTISLSIATAVATFAIHDFTPDFWKFWDAAQNQPVEQQARLWQQLNVAPHQAVFEDLATPCK